MKAIIPLIGAVLISTITLAGPGEKEKVYSIVKQRKTQAWYQEQADLWGAEIETNPQDAGGWLNYYTANRMIKICGGDIDQDDLNGIVDRMEKAIPESFEFYYVAQWNGDDKDGKRDLYDYLLKAYELDPKRPEVYSAFVHHYEGTRDKKNLKKFCELWFNSNDLSPNILASNYNMLESTEQDAVLITAGDNDTYPAWVLQQTQGIRQDVVVFNLYMAREPSYRKSYFDEFGIPEFDKTVEELGGNQEFDKALSKHLQQHLKRPLYFVISVPRYLYNEFESDLYLVGMAYKWSKKSFDNIAMLRRNFEKRFLKDHFKVSLFNDVSQSVHEAFSWNYLVPLITLYNHYKETDEQDRLSEVEGYITTIGENIDQMESVEKLIYPDRKNEVVSKVITDPRDALWGMVQINDDLWASQTEIDNYRYDKFLLDLLKQKRFDDLAVAKSEVVKWEELLLPQYKAMSYEEYFEHGNPSKDHFPVLNISYEAAVLYCEWLTNIYNQLDHKKKKYKRVKFRLPSEEEWEMLAYAGIQEAADKQYKYPWTYAHLEEFRLDSITNENGCYLANVQTMQPAGKKDPTDTKSCPAHDGGVFPVTANSYHPNDFNLYCMIGNVAEMVSEKGICKGGGWNTRPEDCHITKKETYEGPDPNVGFRVIMDVLER